MNRQAVKTKHAEGNEEVESFGHLDDLVAELRDLGLKAAEIHF